MTTQWEPVEIRVIDALARELDLAELPPHTTLRYRQPLAVMPSDCPLLTLWLIQKRYAAQTVAYYDSGLAIGISWQEEAIEQAETLVEDEDASRSLLRAMSIIEDVIFTVSINGLSVERVEQEDGREKDAVYAVKPLSIDLSAPAGVENGLVEGYAMTVEVDLTQTKVRGE